jgi:glutamate-1-semialdehyde 2,1-aminomutase
VPAAFAALTRVLPLDDSEALADLFAREGDRIAAVVIEPIPANHGLLLQRPEFLAELRLLTREHGALLIFDEVISGFRVARGGAAELYGIEPDLATFGKVIGGGLPVGAFGGRREILRHLSPMGAVYQAGTLSGNPLAMSAGLATLRILDRERAWRRLEDLGARLEIEIAPALRGSATPVGLVRCGSLFWFFFPDSEGSREPPRRADQIGARGAEVYGQIFHRLLQRAIALAPSAYEVGFLSLAHRVEHLEQLAEAIAAVLGPQIEEEPLGELVTGGSSR